MIDLCFIMTKHKYKLISWIQMFEITPMSIQMICALVLALYLYVNHLVLFKKLFWNKTRVTSIILAFPQDS